MYALTSRRSFIRTIAGSVAGRSLLRGSSTYAIENCPTEWSYSSAKQYKDPFNQVDLDVIFHDPQGREHRVPAFWSGENDWTIRYAPPAPGTYTYKTVCSDTANRDLHGRSGNLQGSANTGENSIFRHWPVRHAPHHR